MRQYHERADKFENTQAEARDRSAAEQRKQEELKREQLELRLGDETLQRKQLESSVQELQEKLRIEETKRLHSDEYRFATTGGNDLF